MNYLSHDPYFPERALLKKPSKMITCVGPYSFFEQGRTNPNGPARACLKKSSNKMNARSAIFLLFSSVLVHFLIRSYDKMLID